MSISLKSFSRVGTAVMITTIISMYNTLNAQGLITYYVKGDVTFHAKEENDKLLKKGQVISGQDHVRISQGAVAAFTDQSGRHLSIDKKGRYGLEDIAKLLDDQGSDITSDYFKYVWKKFISKKEEDPDKMPMNVIGGVSRAEDIGMISPGNGAVITRAFIRFEWEDTGMEQYLFIFNEDNEPILKLRTQGSSLDLYALETGLIRGKVYQWAVSRNSRIDNMVKFSFLLPDNAWWEAYEKEREALMDELSSKMDPDDLDELLQDFEKSKGIF